MRDSNFYVKTLVIAMFFKVRFGCAINFFPLVLNHQFLLPAETDFKERYKLLVISKCRLYLTPKYIVLQIYRFFFAISTIVFGVKFWCSYLSCCSQSYKL